MSEEPEAVVVASNPEDSIRETIRLLIADVLATTSAEVEDEADIGDDLNADSLDLVDISIRVEEAFPGVRLTDEECADAKTLNGWTRLVVSKRSGR